MPSTRLSFRSVLFALQFITALSDIPYFCPIFHIGFYVYSNEGNARLELLVHVLAVILYPSSCLPSILVALCISYDRLS